MHILQYLAPSTLFPRLQESHRLEKMKRCSQLHFVHLYPTHNNIYST